MRKVREVLRLKHTLGMSLRQISEATGVGKTVVGEYVRRAGVIGITWPVPEEIDDAELERRLFPVPCETGPPRAAIDWRKVHEEMKRRSVTLVLLWQEYRAEQADGYGYSRFCDLYGEWRKTISATMRQTHPAGEKLFVDYAGDTVPVFDQVTNAQRPAHIFVAALGASNYTYAEARWSEGLADWIGAHVNALTAIGGVPKAVVCDNLKAGVTKPSRYEPGINRSYQDLAEHYGFAVLPARVRKPRDKAKVEVAVLIVAALRPGAAAQPALLLARRAQRRDPGVRERPQRQGHAQDRQEPRGAVGDDRPAGARCASGRALPLRRMEEVPGRARLSRRDRQALLLGAVAADPRDRRGAHHRHDGRDLAQGQPHCEPRPLGTCRTGTRRSPSTCRARTAATPSGRRRG